MSRVGGTPPQEWIGRASPNGIHPNFRQASGLGAARARIESPLRDFRLYTTTSARRCCCYRRRCSRPNQGAHCHIGVLKALYDRRPGFTPVAVIGIAIGAVTAAVLES